LVVSAALCKQSSSIKTMSRTNSNILYGVYIPVYFQACKGVSPIQSGVDLLPYSFSVAPAAIFIGATTTVFKRYRIQNVVAWCFVLVGMGLQTTLHATSATRNWVGFEFIAGIGLGILVRLASLILRFLV